MLQDGDEICFVLDQHSYLDFVFDSASSLKRQFKNRLVHSSTQKHYPESKPTTVFSLILRALREATNTNFIVFGVLLKQIFCFNTSNLKYKKQDNISCIQVNWHYKNNTQRLGLVQSGHHHHFIENKLVLVMI
jgi:hypothetical protein